MEKAHRKAKTTAADKEAAKRLERLIAAAQRRDPSLSLERIGQMYGELAGNAPKTQGAISQYKNGDIPLNLEAVVLLASILHCHATEIRDDLPTLRVLFPESRELTVIATPVWPFEKEIPLARYERLRTKRKAEIQGLLRNAILQAEGDEAARLSKPRKRRAA